MLFKRNIPFKILFGKVMVYDFVSQSNVKSVKLFTVQKTQKLKNYFFFLKREQQLFFSTNKLS